MRKLEDIVELLSARAMKQNSALSEITRHDWFVPPTVEGLHSFNAGKPAYTAILPIHNQEEIIGRFLRNHLQVSLLPHDLIVIFDCCTDRSREAFQALSAEMRSSNLCSCLAISTRVPYFETACDNLGFVLADSAFLIEFQPDLLVKTIGYDRRMLDLLGQGGVGAVSGRGGHSLRDIYGPPKLSSRLFNFWHRPSQRQNFWPEAEDRVGLLGPEIESHGLAVDDETGRFYLCETVNRGPFAVRKSLLEQVGYLDHRNFFLGNDDHDFNLRCWLQAQKRPAYLPLKLETELRWGSTRKARDPLNDRVFKSLSSRPDNSFLKKYQSSYRPYCKTEEFTLASLSS
jgi:hypothetical protein